jgi:hypothetical protein
MKEYWSIPGPSKAPNSHCIAFYKYDGSNIRFEWSKKRGWYKFGTRKTIIDYTHPQFGGAIPIFLNTLAEPIIKVIKNEKNYRSIDNIVVFGEYFSNSSIGCFHDYDELKTQGKVVIFDVNLHKKGFVSPRDFVRDFGHITNTAEVIYEGNFNQEFIQNVYDGKYPVKEGVVAKGGSGHGLWMAKAKTKWWFDEIKKRMTEIEYEKFLKEEI